MSLCYQTIEHRILVVNLQFSSLLALLLPSHNRNSWPQCWEGQEELLPLNSFRKGLGVKMFSVGFLLPVCTTREDSWRSKILSCIWHGGSGCSTAVNLEPRDRYVMGSNPARCCTSSSLSIQWCVLNQVPHIGATPLIFLKKYLYLAVQLQAKKV